VVHLLGLVLLLGGIGLLDLRLLGAFPRLPPAALHDAVRPLAIAGLLLLAASGSILFAADARALAGNGSFQWKLVLIGLALLNALAFRTVASDRLQQWAEAVPVTAQLSALLSLFAWLAVMTLGRMIAYS
jgi:hypothetical protein